MNFEDLKPGMMVEYHKDVVEVLDVDPELNIAYVKRQKDAMTFTASCNDIVEDPQMHTDCMKYY